MTPTWIVNGLTDIGMSLWEQALHSKERSEQEVRNFEAIMAHLDRENYTASEIRQIREALTEAVQKEPLLQEFRKSDDSTITFERDTFDRCLVKENDKPILRCSRESRIGRIGLVYCRLEQMKSEICKTKKGYEHVA